VDTPTNVHKYNICLHFNLYLIVAITIVISDITNMDDPLSLLISDVTDDPLSLLISDVTDDPLSLL